MFGRFNIPAVREFYGSTEGTYGTINIRTLIVSDTEIFVGSNTGIDPRFSCRLIWLQTLQLIQHQHLPCLSLLFFLVSLQLYKKCQPLTTYSLQAPTNLSVQFLSRYSHSAPDLKYLHYGVLNIGQLHISERYILGKAYVFVCFLSFLTL